MKIEHILGEIESDVVTSESKVAKPLCSTKNKTKGGNFIIYGILSQLAKLRVYMLKKLFFCETLDFFSKFII